MQFFFKRKILFQKSTLIQINPIACTPNAPYANPHCQHIRNTSIIEDTDPLYKLYIYNKIVIIRKWRKNHCQNRIMCYNNTARKYGKKHRRGDMAQLVERRVRNAKVRGSNPLISTSQNTSWTPQLVFFFYAIWGN